MHGKEFSRYSLTSNIEFWYGSSRFSKTALFSFGNTSTRLVRKLTLISRSDMTFHNASV